MRMGDHPSRAGVAAGLQRPTRGGGSGSLHVPCWSCSRWGLPSRSGHPDRWCALTAPFHPYPVGCLTARWGGLLSVALSAGRPAWALPSTLPCGARTFLNPEHAGAAVAWPTATPFYRRHTGIPPFCRQRPRAEELLARSGFVQAEGEGDVQQGADAEQLLDDVHPAERQDPGRQADAFRQLGEVGAEQRTEQSDGIPEHLGEEQAD